MDLILFGFANVGWIGDDEVKGAGFESLEQVSVMKMNAALDPVTSRVGASDLEGCGGDVRRMNFSLREFFGEGERDAAGAGADVDDTALLDRTEPGAARPRLGARSRGGE